MKKTFGIVQHLSFAGDHGAEEGDSVVLLVEVVHLLTDTPPFILAVVNRRRCDNVLVVALVIRLVYFGGA